jgi:hypothetical protein
MIVIDRKCAEIADATAQYQGLNRAFRACGAFFTLLFKALAVKKASPPGGRLTALRCLQTANAILSVDLAKGKVIN